MWEKTKRATLDDPIGLFKVAKTQVESGEDESVRENICKLHKLLRQHAVYIQIQLKYQKKT